MYRALLACAGALLASAPAIAADRIEAVAFPAGATTATLKGKVHGYDGVAYTLETREGQTLQLLFAPSNRFCFFNVFASGETQAVHMGAAGSNEFGRTIPAGGTYRAQVYLMRNAARRGDTCRYSLSVEFTGAPGGASAGRLPDRRHGGQGTGGHQEAALPVPAGSHVRPHHGHDPRRGMSLRTPNLRTPNPAGFGSTRRPAYPARGCKPKRGPSGEILPSSSPRAAACGSRVAGSGAGRRCRILPVHRLALAGGAGGRGLPRHLRSGDAGP